MTDANEWRGRVGDTWAEEWRLTDMSFAGLAGPLDAAIAAAAPDRGRALDMGCGAGATSLALAAARPGLEILGVDLSERLVNVARERASGAPNVRFRAANITEIADMTEGADSFDLAFSRHGVMFFPDPLAAFRNIRRVLKPGATLVFSCFGDLGRNPWASDVATAIGLSAAPAGDGYAPGPFAFSDPDFVHDILERSGFAPERPRLIDFAYRAGDGPDAVERAIYFFRRIGPAARLLAAADPAARTGMLDRLRAFLAAREHGDAVEFPAAAWIWTARTKEGEQ